MAIEDGRRLSQRDTEFIGERRIPGVVRLPVPSLKPQIERRPDGMIIQTANFDDPKVMEQLIRAVDEGGWMSRVKSSLRRGELKKIEYALTAGALIATLYWYEHIVKHDKDLHDFRPLINKMDKFRRKFRKNKK